MSSGYINIPAGPKSVQEVILPFTATENIMAFQMVVSVDGITAEVANNNTTVQNARTLGMALSSAPTNSIFNVLMFGTFVDVSFSTFTLNNSIFLSHTGFLTQIIPTTPDFFVICGKYLGANTIFINISEPIQL